MKPITVDELVSELEAEREAAYAARANPELAEYSIATSCAFNSWAKLLRARGEEDQADSILRRAISSAAGYVEADFQGRKPRPPNMSQDCPYGGTIESER